MKQGPASRLLPEGIETLHDLVARMDEHRGPWGEWKGGEQTGEHAYTMPYVVSSDIATEAMQFLYDHDLNFHFAWPNWNEGRAIFERTGLDRFAGLARLTNVKPLTEFEIP